MLLSGRGYSCMPKPIHISVELTNDASIHCSWNNFLTFECIIWYVIFSCCYVSVVQFIVHGLSTCLMCTFGFMLDACCQDLPGMWPLQRADGLPRFLSRWKISHFGMTAVDIFLFFPGFLDTSDFKYSLQSSRSLCCLCDLFKIFSDSHHNILSNHLEDFLACNPYPFIIIIVHHHHPPTPRFL